MSWKDIFRAVLHIPVGILIAKACLLNSALGISMLLLFVVYELCEDWHIKDQAWRDIFGALIGMAIVIVWYSIGG